ncbi:hypothetical protein CVT24_003718 [Panaeolus cyanescens]|uniref:Rho-GAP domain-containing protein n=1 Tax=Panaeolus cyanescens TaxID=181874 RepID=A0A409YXR6_9AGAR|nr:hypothetical protein CVT24_003718 [Panaeolus cyanescens]
MPPTSLNLKQRLAALSTATSSTFSNRNNASGSYSQSPTTPIGRKKIQFNPPTWMKRSNASGSSVNGSNEQLYEDEEIRMVQEVLGKMIFQAGVDFETRPMVVLNASALPDPDIVSYDLLLTRILSYLNLYVLFSLAGAIISPKFFRKLTYITTLSELALHVPITQIDIPPAVYQENLKFERKITLPTPIRSSIFGVPLEELMGFNGEKGAIPRVVKDSIQFLRDTGLQDEGLFRRSPSSAMLRSAQEAYDRGNVVSLENFGDPHIAAVLLKKYLRDLPEPIFPERVYPIIRRCPWGVKNGETEHEAEFAAMQYIRDVLLPELIPCAYILLSHILHLLHDVSLRSSSNRMDATNLAIVICPNLVKGSNPMKDVMMCSVGPTAMTPYMHSASGQLEFSPTSGSAEGKTTLGQVITLCIRRYYEIFDEVMDRTEAVPIQISVAGAAASTSSDGSLGGAKYVLRDEEEDDDDSYFDPASPNAAVTTFNGTITGRRHKSTGSRSSNAARSTQSNDAPPPPSSYARSAHVGASPSFGNGTFRYPANGKAKSVISFESSGGGPMGTMRRGSIALGRGTKKGSGAGVEAVGVTVMAENFFTAPGATAKRDTRAEEQEEETAPLSFEESRKKFQGAS